MNILVNASNISGGGGAQVTDSLCRYLIDYPQHHFIVVLSSALDDTANVISNYPNTVLVRYNYPSSDWKSLITLHNVFLDNLVDKYLIDCVLTVFGPMKWKPKCPHICGFALSHIVMPESPFFGRMSFGESVKWHIRIKIWEMIFRRSAKHFYTENPLISERVKIKFKPAKVDTVTNYYNQIFDNPENWQERKLPDFDGIQLLDVAAYGPHKNQTIALAIAKYLKKTHPDFKFRFIFTFDKKEYPEIPQDIEECFYFTGKVNIAECPSLYQQCDVEFQPTLLECFTATYPEGMKMGLPIITTDLEFAQGLCGNAAVYYPPLSAEAAADTIYMVCSDLKLQQRLIDNGKSRLKIFDSYKHRANKLILMCEEYGN